MRSGSRVRKHRGWIEVFGAEWKSDAQELSQRFLTSSVWCAMQTPIDQVWLFCFHQGVVMRELRFSAEKQGWSVNRGSGMPFEDAQALALWLKKWRRHKPPLVARDGVELLNAFIGASPAKKKRQAKAKAKPKRRRVVKRRPKKA